MENRINKIINMKDGKKLFVVNQVNYKGRIFLLTNELIDDDLSDKTYILEEVKENDSIYLDIIEDKELFQTVLNAFKEAL